MVWGLRRACVCVCVAARTFLAEQAAAPWRRRRPALQTLKALCVLAPRTTPRHATHHTRRPSTRHSKTLNAAYGSPSKPSRSCFALMFGHAPTHPSVRSAPCKNDSKGVVKVCVHAASHRLNAANTHIYTNNKTLLARCCTPSPFRIIRFFGWCERRQEVEEVGKRRYMCGVCVCGCRSPAVVLMKQVEGFVCFHKRVNAHIYTVKPAKQSKVKRPVPALHRGGRVVCGGG